LRKAARKAKKQPSDSGSEDSMDNNDSDPVPFMGHKASPTHAPDEPVSSSSSGNEDSKSSNLKRKRSSSKIVVPLESPKQKPTTAATPQRNGRHLLRGRNIQAKRMAFADMKGLDEIFMKTG